MGWLGAGLVVGSLTCCWERDWRFALAFSTIRFTEDSLRGFVRWTGDEGALNERLGADACGDAACLGLAWDCLAGWLFRGVDDPFWARADPTKTIKTRHAVLRCNLLDMFSDDMAILLSSTLNLRSKPLADPANGLAYYYKAIRMVLVTAKDASIKENEGEFRLRKILTKLFRIGIDDELETVVMYSLQPTAYSLQPTAYSLQPTDVVVCW